MNRGVIEKTKLPRLVRDVMQREVITVPLNMPVAALADLLLREMISGVPVVDPDENLAGIVSLADIAAHVVRTSPDDGSVVPSYPRYHSDLWLPQGLSEGFAEGLSLDDDDEAVQVQDIMSSAVYDVDETDDLESVVDLMLRARIHRAVVTRSDRVVGILTTTDLMRILPGVLRAARAAELPVDAS